MWTALVWLCIAVGVRSQDTWEVQIDQGTLRGYRDADGHMFSFWDVPYATAPSGSDKFKAPLPGPVWTETFDAVQRNIICTQGITDTINVETMLEDCLIANIFVPEANVTNLPVLVYVHGGAYHLYSASLNPFTDLVKTQGVIVVTFNYRLGVRGFLCLGTEDVPGNAGLKDQLAMLRWVNRNIASFGGNPNEVTIGGCSAGAGSVDILILSPLTAGLFNKVITQSGSCLAYTGAQIDPIENAKAFALNINFTNVDDIVALEEFYKTAPNELLHRENSDMTYNAIIYFTPCVERDTGTGEERLLTESPWRILSTGQYLSFPTLYSYTDMEGSVYTFQNLNKLGDMNENFAYYMPFDLQFESEEQKEEVARTVREYYFGDGEMNETVSSLDFIDYYSDIMFVYPMLRGLKMRRHANNDTVYLFEYSFTDENVPYAPNTNVKGALHCAQERAVQDEDVTNASEEYIALKAFLREVWGNFIKYGNPAPINSSLPEWPPVSGDWSPHMAIHSNISAEETSFMVERARIWENIYDQYYHEPAAPVPGSAKSLVHSIILITGAFITKYILS